ncbi:MATE family efflux transporter [Diplocloster agilis]|uniref:MATE family efflux transporter n=1 Tax=Diplocloster agilis TaxID=2850323 RepID=UPI0008221FE9|nr:MATE family efflux transporter [Suonthocola fibrivorans]MCU6733447.1 MATE family efflux transporter [Suonthocola fibrivorans]SCI93579.1 Staphylococcal virulence regulator protein A [uncultured Clostridium sp.]
MDLLHGKVRKIYFKYLAAAFGSALISSIYGLVDMAMVGQYQGPAGTAALAVVAPVWNIIYSLGLLTGIGGSVLFSTARGKGQGEAANEYFTAALVGTIVLALASWGAIVFFDRPMLKFFGAEETLLPLAREYLGPVKFAVPFFLFNQMLAAFLRNDSNPGLATAAVLAGGIFNVAGDYICVFRLDMGIKGAGVATAIGALITFLIMLSHFLTGKNTLRFTRPKGLPVKLKNIGITGFSTFFIDIAMGILTTLFNRQIMKYAGTNELAVYGVIVNISTIVQCCAYSVGQASQPIFSINFGARQWERIRQTLRYALLSAAFFGLAWTALILQFPNGFIRIFMNPTAEVLAVGPSILRAYGISFLLLPFNIFSTYYFQSLMKPRASFFVSVFRGVLVSGLLIWFLPLFMGAGALWFAMPVTELLVAAAVVYLIVKYTKELPVK